MSLLMEKLSVGATYIVTLTGIALDGDATRKNILFVLGLILLGLQITLHIIRIQKERNTKNKKKD